MFEYTVQKGDTLWLIAKRFGITLENLIKANTQIKDPNKIYPGNVINIPLTVQGGNVLYTAQSGDTLWSIAKKFGISLESLISANPQIKNADLISVGETIYVPVATNSTGRTYTVKSGDTLWKIAQRFEITLDALIKANPQISNPNLIFPGQVINIPTSVSTPGTPTTPQPRNLPYGRLYVVRSGDTFFNIAQRFALNMESLILANPQICNEDALFPGQQLYLPGVYTVVSGDTLNSIANMYNVTVSEILRINPSITNANNINVGQKIAIPLQNNGNMALYTVQRGDTLFKIANTFNIPIEAIRLANSSVANSDTIFPGQQLNIPGPHIVQSGQTLAQLANLYSVPFNDLLNANKAITNPNLIYPGMMINIPACTSSSSCQQAIGIDYTVQSGDTLSGIAAMYNMSVANILAVNPDITNGDMIFPGQVIRIPVGYTDYVCYIVKSGDSLYKIARMYGVSLNSLIAANPQITSVDNIQIGEIIRIPLRSTERSFTDEEGELRATTGVTHPFIYTVQKGDSLYQLAKRYNTTVQQMKIANPNVNEKGDIIPGQQLIILPSDMVCEYRCLDCPWFGKGREE